jgi:Flp pilus assembly protein CpaB
MQNRRGLFLALAVPAGRRFMAREHGQHLAAQAAASRPPVVVAQMDLGTADARRRPFSLVDWPAHLVPAGAIRDQRRRGA